MSKGYFLDQTLTICFKDVAFLYWIFLIQNWIVSKWIFQNKIPGGREAVARTTTATTTAATATTTAATTATTAATTATDDGRR